MTEPSKIIIPALGRLAVKLSEDDDHVFGAPAPGVEYA